MRQKPITAPDNSVAITIVVMCLTCLAFLALLLYGILIGHS